VIGASGTGKTFTSQLLSKVLGLPFASIDVSAVSATGYIGDDLSGVLYLLAQSASEMGLHPQDGGVVFLDEIDKIAKTAYESATTVGVQFEALRLLDGGEVAYPTTGLSKWGSAGATMDTSGLLVVASGAFSWLRDEWSGSKAGIGFAGESGGRLSDDRQLLATKGGMVVELLNRFTRDCPDAPADRRGHRRRSLQNKFGPCLRVPGTPIRRRGAPSPWTPMPRLPSVEVVGRQGTERARAEGGAGADPARAAVHRTAEQRWSSRRELVEATLYPDTEIVDPHAFSEREVPVPQQGRLTFP
jgi:SpoVK/Ycf46/Vps4 family AAA+-type ATPase